MSFNILGKRWYYCLVPKDGRRCLLDDFTKDKVDESLIICYASGVLPNGNESLNAKGNPRKLYSLFDDYIDLYKYMELFDPKLRCFFELIPGEKPQKPKFDVDLKEESDDLIQALLSSIKTTLIQLKQTFNPNKDICIYTSHGESKRSYHIVVNGFYCDDVWEAQAFYFEVMSRIDHPLKESIDRAVYSSRQQFRVLGSQKFESGRPKTLQSTFEIDGDKFEYFVPANQPRVLHDLRTSLVQFTSDSIRLPSLKKEVKRQEYKGVSDDDLDRMINLFFDAFPDSDAFSVRSTTLSSVILARHRPTYCHACERTHEAENPYLFLERGIVYFSCRRSFLRSFVGVLEEQKEFDNKTKDQEKEESEEEGDEEKGEKESEKEETTVEVFRYTRDFFVSMLSPKTEPVSQYTVKDLIAKTRKLTVPTFE